MITQILELLGVVANGGDGYAPSIQPLTIATANNYIVGLNVIDSYGASVGLPVGAAIILSARSALAVNPPALISREFIVGPYGDADFDGYFILDPSVTTIATGSLVDFDVNIIADGYDGYMQIVPISDLVIVKSDYEPGQDVSVPLEQQPLAQGPQGPQGIPGYPDVTGHSGEVLTNDGYTVAWGEGGTPIDGLGGAYNSATATSNNIIQMTAASGPVLVRNVGNVTSSTLFGVQDQTGTTKYLDVTKNQITATAASAQFTLSNSFTALTQNYSDFANRTDLIVGDATIGLLLEGLQNGVYVDANQFSPIQTNTITLGSESQTFAEVYTPRIGPASASQHNIPNVSSDTLALLNAAQELRSKTFIGESDEGTLYIAGALTGSDATNSLFLKYQPAEAGSVPWVHWIGAFDNATWPRKDQVSRFGWNVGPGGGLINTGDKVGGWSSEYESSYQGGHYQMERHEVYWNPIGGGTRIWSCLSNLEAPYDSRLFVNAESISIGGFGASVGVEANSVGINSPDGLTTVYIDNQQGWLKSTGARFQVNPYGESVINANLIGYLRNNDTTIFQWGSTYTLNNNFDHFQMGTDASSGTQLTNSSRTRYRGSYWNGSDPTRFDAEIRNIMDSTGPTGHFSFEFNEVVAATLNSVGNLAAGNGSGAAPSYSFTNSTDMGLYRAGAGWVVLQSSANGRLGISDGESAIYVSNAEAMHWTTAYVSTPLPLRLADGSGAAPSYSFTNATDMGMYRVGSRSLQVQESNGGYGFQINQSPPGSGGNIDFTGTISGGGVSGGLYDVGTSGRPWQNGYFSGTMIASSFDAPTSGALNFGTTNGATVTIGATGSLTYISGQLRVFNSSILAGAGIATNVLTSLATGDVFVSQGDTGYKIRFTFTSPISANTVASIDAYGNFTTIGNIVVDGYTINPSNSTSGQVLAYNGSAYVPTTITSETVTADAAIVQYALVKVSTSTAGRYVHLATTDGAALMVGVSTSSAAGAASTFTATFMQGTVTTMLSDGFAIIPIGSGIINSPLTAGRVRAGSGVNLIGYNIGPQVAATVDAQVSVR